MGGRGLSDSFGFLAPVVRSKETAEDAPGLCRNLGDLHRVPRFVKLTAPLRFAGSRMETTRVSLEENPA